MPDTLLETLPQTFLTPGDRQGGGLGISSKKLLVRNIFTAFSVIEHDIN